ncbi:MAG: alpha/beta hydrolase [Alphaproteobacteria bacterium]
MAILENGPVRIHYKEAGSGFPLLVVPGGGLNATIAKLGGPGSFDPLAEFADTYRVVAADLRNAVGGGSSGPVEVDRPWDAFADDQLAVMDHLGIDRFLLMGFCIGGPMCWNLMRRVPDRVVAAVLVHPSGVRPELPTQFYDNNSKGWAPEIRASRPDITAEMTDAFLRKMYPAEEEFLFTVTRDFVRNCQTPVLVMPDDIPPHPYAVAMESALLAPNAQVSLYPWREPADRIPLALRHVRSFLAAHQP